jgi:hypothetical protein
VIQGCFHRVFEVIDESRIIVGGGTLAGTTLAALSANLPHLGAGGYGSCFKAQMRDKDDPNLTHAVALKVFTADHAAASVAAKLEGNNAQRLRGARAATLLGGKWDTHGLSYLVYDLYAQGDLSEAVKTCHWGRDFLARRTTALNLLQSLRRSAHEWRGAL